MIFEAGGQKHNVFLAAACVGAFAFGVSWSLSDVLGFGILVCVKSGVVSSTGFVAAYYIDALATRMSATSAERAASRAGTEPAAVPEAREEALPVETVEAERLIPVGGRGQGFVKVTSSSDPVDLAWRRALVRLLLWSEYEGGVTVSRLVGEGKALSAPQDWMKFMDVLQANGMLLRENGKTTRLADGWEYRSAASHIESGRSLLGIPASSMPPAVRDLPALPASEADPEEEFEELSE